jgi:hypothetical protein
MYFRKLGLLFTIALLSGNIAEAGVVFTVGPGGGNPAENVLYNQSGLVTGPAPVIMGATNQTSVVLNIDGQGTNLTIHGGGQASVVSDSGDPYSSVLFTPNGSPPPGLNALASFTDFKLNINATANGTVSFSVNNGAFVSGALPLDKNGENFFRITASGSDVITSLLVTASGSIIDNIKQIRIGGLTGIGPNPLPNPIIEPEIAPEPASLLAWGFLAATGAMVTRIRRRLLANAG